ncbi:voltage-gated potassium channel [Hypoxylon sp. NC1633]|nr:voltage-gated potassium channel [Hypoxylon sp. NC1633]
MDDGDLNNNIGEHAQDVDDPEQEKHGQDGNTDDRSQFDPSRWWFASAAFPLIAGTLGPVASAFSICALVKNWRQHILPGSDVTKAIFIEDPAWLLAVNAVQLVIALVANAFLLLNMTKRVRFSIAQPITIVGWYISAICLIALCATTSGPLILEPEIEYVWSQAFYYGMYAAILYFIVATLMVITVWGAQAGHYGKDFELTMSQRTLMLQTIMFLVYLLVGALVFSKVEGWDYLDSVYWADVTLFTIGFGDVSPQTRLGRGLLVPYALVGIVSLGLVIGSIRSMILDRGKHRLDARMLERQRRLLIRRMRRKGRADDLEPIDEEALDTSPDPDGERSRRTELERRQREFLLMRKIQRQASTRERWTSMAVSSSTWVVLWLVGAKIFQECEAPYQGWAYFDGFYFSFTALTTIGYGDLTPVSTSAKSFFVFWSLLALPTTTILISNAGDTIVKGIKDGTLLLGNITILPGEHGFRKSTKQMLAKLSCGILFMDDDTIEEDPPGFLGAARERHDDDEEEEEEEEEEGEEEMEEMEEAKSFKSKASEVDNLESNRMAKKDALTGESGPSSSPVRSRPAKRNTKLSESTSKSPPEEDARPKSPGRTASIARESFPTELPKTRAEYHLVLIDEISRVTKHLRHSPPRKYTFKEWAWYLRLIGEDESNANNHRRPEKRPARDRGDNNRSSNTNTTTSTGTKLSRVLAERLHKDAVLGRASSTPTPTGGGDPASEQRDASEEHSEEGNAKEADTNDKPSKWSWVGHRSPLMETREEAEWILDKLEQRLREELAQAVAGEGGGRDGLREVEEEERVHEQTK